MLRGLQVRMSVDEFKARISERIRIRSAKADDLDERIKKREGDHLYDVRVSDGLFSLGELIEDRDRHRQRISELALFRDRLAETDVVSLTMDDLQASDLLDRSAHAPRREEDEVPEGGSGSLIEGLKVTMPGHEVRLLLQTRIAEHEDSAAWWTQQAARTPEEQTADEPLLPDELCRNEAARHGWRARVLRFIRDHLDANDTYHIGAEDLAFGELLPPPPGSLEQAEYEDRNRVGFSLERITKHLPRVMR